MWLPLPPATLPPSPLPLPTCFLRGYEVEGLSSPPPPSRQVPADRGASGLEVEVPTPRYVQRAHCDLDSRAAPDTQSWDYSEKNHVLKCGLRAPSGAGQWSPGDGGGDEGAIARVALPGTAASPLLRACLLPFSHPCCRTHLAGGSSKSARAGRTLCCGAS